MLAHLAILIAQTDLPKTFEDLVKRMDDAYRQLSSYTDTWLLSDDDHPGYATKFLRMIDGKRCSLRVSIVTGNGKTDQPLFYEGANGSEEYMVAFSHKSYYTGKDTGDWASTAPLSGAEQGSLVMGVTPNSIGIACNPPLVLKSVESNPSQISRGRVAVAEADNPETKNRLSIQISFLNRWWLPTDVVATVTFRDGHHFVQRLHPTLIGMNATLPKRAFDLDPSWIKGFTKKTLDDELKDAIGLVG